MLPLAPSTRQPFHVPSLPFQNLLTSGTLPLPIVGEVSPNRQATPSLLGRGPEPLRVSQPSCLENQDITWLPKTCTRENLTIFQSNPATDFLHQILACCLQYWNSVLLVCSCLGWGLQAGDCSESTTMGQREVAGARVDEQQTSQGDAVSAESKGRRRKKHMVQEGGRRRDRGRRRGGEGQQDPDHQGCTPSSFEPHAEDSGRVHRRSAAGALPPFLSTRSPGDTPQKARDSQRRTWRMQPCWHLEDIRGRREATLLFKGSTTAGTSEQEPGQEGRMAQGRPARPAGHVWLGMHGPGMDWLTSPSSPPAGQRQAQSLPFSS